MLAYATVRARSVSLFQGGACVCYSFALIIQLSIALNDRLYTRGRIIRLDELGPTFVVRLVKRL